MIKIPFMKQTITVIFGHFDPKQYSGGVFSMKLSVIMPIYNCEKYIEKAIGSVLSQGVESFEIIAVDDFSQDNSAEILYSLAKREPRIKAHFNEKNIGVAATRNKALALARGEYVTFCDADDTVTDGAYLGMLRDIKDSDVLIAGYADTNDSGDSHISKVMGCDRRSAFLSLFSVCCLWNKLFRRASLKDLSFDEDMKIGEDVVFLSRYAVMRPNFRVSRRIVYNHFHHGNASFASLTHIYSYSAFTEHIKCRERMLDICDTGGISECRDYVFLRFSEYLDRFIPFIADEEERRRAFELYKSFMTKYDWSAHASDFFGITGVDFGDFLASDAESYIRLKCETPPRKKLLHEFETGKIGFRWILKYFAAWLGFKLKRISRTQ